MTTNPPSRDIVLSMTRSFLRPNPTEEDLRIASDKTLANARTVALDKLDVVDIDEYKVTYVKHLARIDAEIARREKEARP